MNRIVTRVKNLHDAIATIAGMEVTGLCDLGWQAVQLKSGRIVGWHDPDRGIDCTTYQDALLSEIGYWIELYEASGD